MKKTLSWPSESNVSRREFLLRGGGGFGAVALSYLLGTTGSNAAGATTRGDARTLIGTHFPARARSVIFLFMEGGPSHIDLFDPKPLLNRLAGQKLPESFGPVLTAMGEVDAPLMAAPRTWKHHGKSGIWVSELYPRIAECVDDIAVIRSCVSDGLNHANGVCQMNTGSTLGGRPSLGSWVTYGLGTENENMPAFVVLLDSNNQIAGGPRNWGTGFMPAAFQGIPLQGGEEPIRFLKPPSGMTFDRQRRKLSFLRDLNEKFAANYPDATELDARIRSYELAFRMQAAAPEAVDLSRESEATRSMYGMDREETAVFGRNCLLARRLVERGVRFVQLYHGAGSKWDAHTHLETNHAAMCRSSDQPIAALLNDLKQRGMLDETLVVWGGEFGRTPMSEKGDGRDHNPWGFTMWMAGGGVRGGRVIGETDELGLRAIRDPLHVHDLHATILYLLGVDHTKLVYLNQGRPERVDANEGHAFRQIAG